MAMWKIWNCQTLHKSLEITNALIAVHVTSLPGSWYIARNKRTRAYIFRILLRLRYRRSQWQTLGAWYKASALGLYVRGICPPIIV